VYPWNRILIPTDFSTASHWSFDTAVDMAGTTGAELLILHVRATWGSQPDKLRFPADESVYQAVEQHELEKLRDSVRRANATIQARLLVRKAPNPGDEICRAAKSEGVDLIVMATHARHHVAHLLIGSTTMKLLIDPPAPVLAIRYGVRKREGMRRIVVPVHPQQATHPARDLAVTIAKRHGAELHLVTVCEEPDRARADGNLRTIADGLTGVQVRTGTIKGSDVEKEIVKYIERVDADLLFLNAHGEPGPVKRDIIRHAGTPVMIVPA
jgi:nucleotide-binding universal stress UspA family protein